jgi:hypothetical protein
MAGRIRAFPNAPALEYLGTCRPHWNLAKRATDGAAVVAAGGVHDGRRGVGSRGAGRRGGTLGWGPAIGLVCLLDRLEVVFDRLAVLGIGDRL